MNCPYCSAKNVAGIEGCQATYYHIALTFNMTLTSGLGRALFDTYCLQHPEIYCQSAKSYAAHLAFMVCWIEQAGRPEVLEATHRGMNGPFKSEKAVVPLVGKRGTLTILHLQQAQAVDEVDTQAKEWINNVWEAYAELHVQAKMYWQNFVAGII